ncbi:MAG: ShlB/FhaC/HecB family hemolysin secretion/activation protein [Opitutaceae bacterium]|nr:ShlB/FhaC/HecB family hemolysin secretion/activation protein [Opitutaceae bacterium]
MPFLYSFLRYKKNLLSGFVAKVVMATLACAVGIPLHAETSAYRLRRILIADTETKVTALQPPPEAGPVIAQEVPLLATAEFAAVMASYFDQSITIELLNRLVPEISNYLKNHDRPIVDVQIPNQNVATGDLRLVVTIGRYNQLKFSGNRWFSRELLEAKLGIKPGDEIRLSTLDEAVNWANANPFRHIQVVLNNLPNQANSKDLLIFTQEVLPLRLACSYDNTGPALLGENRYTAAIQFGNAWGLDHLASYQFTTTDRLRLSQTHSGDYRIPLPWHHYLQLAAAYGTQQPSFADGLFNLKGKSLLTSLRYIAPVTAGPWSMEFSAGLDFKRTNNNFEFGGYQISSSENDVYQASFGTTVLRRDAYGATSLGLNLSLSPGSIDSRNTDLAFASTRYGSTSRYAVGQMQIQRLTRLPGQWQVFSRVVLQLASTNLLGTEQLSIGGQGTVRGYDERIFTGDEGWIVSNEFQAPQWTTPLRLRSANTKLPPLQTRLLTFWDCGKVAYKHRFSSDIPLDPLMGAGIGLRCNAGNAFSLSADYGWQLRNTTFRQPNRSRGHIQATIAY